MRLMPQLTLAGEIKDRASFIEVYRKTFSSEVPDFNWPEGIQS